MKKLIALILLIITTLPISALPQLRDYDEFDVPTGTHIPVISLQEFSTAYCEEGDKVYLETTSDIYLYDKNVIPTGSKLTGYIDKKNEPIIGTHAAMRVFVNKLYLPDGYEIPIKAFIYSANNNIIGGGLTAPEKYLRMPHYQRWAMFRAMGTLQCVPGASRKMGEHVTVAAGADLIVVLVQPIHITHTLIN